jgi:CHAT domain-containing protein
MNEKVGFAIAWEAGASTQIELFSPELDPAATDYRLKFTPPMRNTIRPPLAGLQLGRGELGPITDRLNKLIGALDQRGAADAVKPVGQTPITDMAREVGSLLYNLILPNDVQDELGIGDLFLEMGVDEALLDYPWELMHDGTEFLCLKHSMGRFVNVSRPAIPKLKPPDAVGVKPLSILLISVPRPQPRAAANIFDELPAVDSETEAIVKAITDLGDATNLTLLRGNDADWTSVAKTITTGRFHIVHYSGHAFFDPKRPYDSSLVLFDADMTTGQIGKFFGNHPPMLFFVNGCESAATRGLGADWKKRYDIFGLARAFLETGAYLLGSRWKIGDKGAAKFAESFYAKLLAEQPLGRAIRDARVACMTALPDDISWASYVFYGDPRLRFRKIPPPQAG